MIPGAHIIAGPRCSVALSPGISSSRKHERPLVRLQLTQAVVSSARILHSENVMDRTMIEFRAVIKPMHSLDRHGLVRSLENGRVRHIGPKTRVPPPHKPPI